MRVRSILVLRHGIKLAKGLLLTVAVLNFHFVMISQVAAEQLSASQTSINKPSPNKILPATGAKGAAYLGRAVQLYQHNSFKDAELNLRQSIAENPNSPAAHYYLASVLVHLNRHEEAIEEFKRSYRLDPFGPTSGYCRKALKAYADKRDAGAKISGKSETGNNADENLEAIDATNSLMHYSQKNAGKKDPQEKLEALRTQAEREKARHQQTADNYGRAMRTTGEGEALNIRENAKSDIDQILHGTRNGLPWVQQAAEAKAAEVQHNADELEKIAKERAGERAAEYKSVSKAKGRALDETVSNLERQLVTKTLPGTPALKHEGTDLFVRSYSPSQQKSPYPEAHAAVARINPAHLVPSDDEEGLSAGQKSAGNALPVNVVKGKVLN